MPQQIDAIYDGGALKPLVPLALPDKTRVTLTVNTRQLGSPMESAHDEWEQRLHSIPKDCGVSLPDLAVSSEGLYE